MLEEDIYLEYLQKREFHIPILCYKADEFIVYMILNDKFAYIYFLNSNKEKI